VNLNKFILLFAVLTFSLMCLNSVNAYGSWITNQSSNPATFDGTTKSVFNITVESNTSYVYIELNYTGTPTNYTMVNGTYSDKLIYNFTKLISANSGVAQYWKVYINDTENNWNTTDTWAFTIARGTPNVYVYIDELPTNKTATYPTTVTIRGNSTTTASPPTFNLSISNITKSSPAVSLSNNSQNPALLTAKLGSWSTGSATYQIVYLNTLNANWTTATNNTIYLIINQNATYVNLNMTYDNVNYINQNVSITVDSDKLLTAFGYLTYTDSGASALLWLGGSAVSNPQSATFSAGSYNYKVNSSGNANYTANGTGLTYYFTAQTSGGGGSGGGPGPVTPTAQCGNNQCEIGEDCTNCVLDCGACVTTTIPTTTTTIPLTYPEQLTNELKSNWKILVIVSIFVVGLIWIIKMK